MSFAEPTVTEPVSPRPREPDVLVCIQVQLLRPRELRFVACLSAARRFAVHWSRYHRDLVTFALPIPAAPRLPCEQLWILP
ncbi:MAG: hypothetical protein J2P18_13165, partial [Nocardia sp.]|nr:hypothetical protein [Nocardia sp.]